MDAFEETGAGNGKGDDGKADNVEEDLGEAKKIAAGIPSRVVVHPLVLLSVVDHYSRVAKDVDKGANKRVVGVLLGETFGSKVEVTNSYAVPFEEDVKNPQTWFFDHNYHESMFAMFKKVNASEKVVGWYSTGPLIRQADLDIHEVVRRYCAQPVFVIVDVMPKEDTEMPTKAYYSIPAVPDAGSLARREFVHLASEIGAEEPEEVGVEHLLREIKDMRVSSITDMVGAKLAALRALDRRMHEMHEYVENVCSGALPPNAKIIAMLQEIFNFCPDMTRPDLAKAFAAKTHDSLLVTYMASLVRSITALHDLINNKYLNRAAEKSEDEKRALLSATRSVGEDDDDGEKDIDESAVQPDPEV